MRILSICLNPAIDVSAVADSIYSVRKIRTRSQRVEPGGGGVNVARVLTSFGHSPELAYFSGGATGKLLDDVLTLYGLETRCFQTDESTRVSFTVHQSFNHQEYRFVPEGPVIGSHSYTNFMDYLANTTLEPDDIVVASGSLPQGIPDSAYADMARIVEGRNAKFFLDSSGVGLAAAVECDAQVFLIKPSLNELQKLAGHRLDETTARDFAKSLVANNHVEHVAVSMGSHGAFLANAHSLIRLPAHLVKVRSAVGAGDSFLGGLIHYIAAGHSIESAFRFGVAAGAAAVMTPGSELCHQEEVERLFAIEPSLNQF